MPISLTTIASGAVISATTLRDRAKSIEDYVNGQIAQGDRTTNWLRTGHVYGPDFQYGRGAQARVPMTGGQTYWAMLPGDPNIMSVFTYETGDGYVQVPGLTRTMQVPESASSRYRALIMASFWVYEYGGEGGGDTVAAPPFQDEETYQAGTAALTIDGVVQTATCRPFFSASDAVATTGGGATNGIIYCHKQYSIAYPYNWGTERIFSPGIAISSPSPGASVNWKHIFVREGSLYARYRIR